ncbi:MAG: chemotaxis protein CheB [Myxococcaceae bacterium]
MIAALVADARAAVRRAVRSALEAQRDIAVVAEASDADGLFRLCEKVRPDVVLLAADLGGGAAVLTLRLMSETPVPVLILEEGGASAAAFEALRLGAIDVVRRPREGDPEAQVSSLVRSVRAASVVRVVRRRPAGVARSPSPSEAPSSGTLVAIGASTGGPPALAQVLGALPEGFPAPILVVQHLVDEFVGQFVAWLDGSVRLEVKVAEDGETLRPGVAYVGSGGHLTTSGDTARIVLEPPVNGHRPSADLLFSSLASCRGYRRVGVLLTGMGEDGARGLKALREAGGYTLAQDEATSVVYGMPRAAIERGAADEVAALGDIGPRIAALAGAL